MDINVNINDNNNTATSTSLTAPLPLYIPTKTNILDSKIPQGSRYTETTSTAVHSDWYESNTEYHVVARLLVGVDTSNMHLYVENNHIIIEATKDSKDRNIFKTSGILDPITQRTSLFLRRTIEVPEDGDVNRITSSIIGDTIMITIPKLIKGKL